MPVLHMQTESVRNLISRINQSCAIIEDIAEDLRRQALKLDNNWSGGRSDDYSNRLFRAAHQISAIENRLQSLRIRGGNEVDEWEANAAELRESFNLGRFVGGLLDGVSDNMDWLWSVTLPLLLTAPILKPGSEILKYFFEEGFDKKLGSILGNSPFNKTHFSEFGEGIGRKINAFIGNMKGGYVGKVGDMFGGLGDFIKHNFKAISVGVVTGGFDIWEGFRDNEGAMKAILTGVVTGGVVIAACVACPALVPILATLGAFQLASYGLSAYMEGLSSLPGMEDSGFNRWSVVFDNLAEGLDLTGYVSDLADGLYDLANLPSGNDDPRLFGEMLDRLTGFGDGLVFIGNEVNNQQFPIPAPGIYGSPVVSI